MNRTALFAASALGLIVASQVSMAGDAAAGKTKAAACVACHGMNGIGTQPLYPNLAGQKEAYIVQTLKGFRSGERTNAIMNAMAKPLSDADIENLAAHFSSLKSQ